MSAESSIITNITSDMITNLQCPVCLQLSDPPLMSCPNGHFTCKPCLLRLSSDSMKHKICPHCRERGFIRNLPYEKMANEILKETELKCPNNDCNCVSEGSEHTNKCCTQTYKYGELSKHLKECKGLQKKYNCPCPRCNESKLYTFTELVEHIMINMGFDTDEEHIFNFLPTQAVGTIDALIAGILIKIEHSDFGRNLNIRLTATESECSYSSSPIINYSLDNDAYIGANSCIIYPPYDFFKNFNKEDTLVINSSGVKKSVTNYSFLIDTNQIYLVRTTCSLTSEMIFCDGHYLNSEYMDEDDPHRVYGIVANYNYNSAYRQEPEPSTTHVTALSPDTMEPVNKKSRRTFERLKYFDSKYYDFNKYTAEMGEEVLNGIKVEIGMNTDKTDALAQIAWHLIY